MSRSLRVQVKLFTIEDLKRFGISLLGTELNHDTKMNQKIEVKRFSSGFFQPGVSFGQFLAGAGQQRQQLCGDLTDKQRAALASLGTAARILGQKTEVKSLPSVGEAIPVEFYIPPKEREKVPVRPMRSIGGGYET